MDCHLLTYQQIQKPALRRHRANPSRATKLLGSPATAIRQLNNASSCCPNSSRSAASRQRATVSVGQTANEPRSLVICSILVSWLWRSIEEPAAHAAPPVSLGSCGPRPSFDGVDVFIGHPSLAVVPQRPYSPIFDVCFFPQFLFARQMPAVHGSLCMDDAMRRHHAATWRKRHEIKALGLREELTQPDSEQAAVGLLQNLHGSFGSLRRTPAFFADGAPGSDVGLQNVYVKSCSSDSEERSFNPRFHTP